MTNSDNPKLYERLAPKLSKRIHSWSFAPTHGDRTPPRMPSGPKWIYLDSRGV